MLEPLAAGKKLALVVNCDRAPEEVITDAFQLQQIVTNLVSNAIRYTESGTISIVVRYWTTNEMLRCYPSDFLKKISGQRKYGKFRIILGNGKIGDRFLTQELVLHQKTKSGFLNPTFVLIPPISPS